MYQLTDSSATKMIVKAFVSLHTKSNSSHYHPRQRPQLYDVISKSYVIVYQLTESKMRNDVWIRTNGVVNILCQGLTKPVRNNNSNGGAVFDLINIFFLRLRSKCSSPFSHFKESSSPISVIGIIPQCLHAYHQMLLTTQSKKVAASIKPYWVKTLQGPYILFGRKEKLLF